MEFIDVNKYINWLKEQQENDDTEVAHETADDILCEFLMKIGYEEIVKEYYKVRKWYA